MTEQPYETTPPPGYAVSDEPADPSSHSEEAPHPPVHDEPQETTINLPEPTVAQSEESVFGWTDLDKMKDSEKLDEILVLLRAFSDTIGQITSAVEEDGISGLLQKAMTGQL